MRSLLPSHPVVVAANGLLQRTSDTTQPFAQDSNFWYLTGLATPDALLVLHEGHSTLLLPDQDAVRDVFDGAYDFAELTERSSITDIVVGREAQARLRALVKSHSTVYTLPVPPVYASRHGMFMNPARRRLVQRLKRLQPRVHVLDIRPFLVALRSIKQPAELHAISRAVDITIDTLQVLRTQLAQKQFHAEHEIDAFLGAGFRTRGAQGHAYQPIVASGAHATTLHYVANSGQLGQGECLVVDAGAEYEHYAADITRTFAVGTPTARQKAVHEAVRAVQLFALDQLRPGVVLREYEQAIVEYMGKQLVALKLLTSSTDMEGVRRYFPHAASHFLGLDVHDVGEYHKPLEEGMVLTCEPGIYIPEEGLGVRLEDDVLVTKTGVRNLSEHCLYDLA